MALQVPDETLAAFGFRPTDVTVESFGVGNIHKTYRVTGESEYLLQTINTHVFKNPQHIADNLSHVAGYLKEHFPEYLFPAPLPSMSGETLYTDTTGEVWRLMPFVQDSVSYNEAPSAEYAYAAAKGFATFTHLLEGLPHESLYETIPKFHDVTLREEQFVHALQYASPQRTEEARTTILSFQKYKIIGDIYRRLVADSVLQKRIQHHDTKINNILFRKGKSEVLAVVDLDTIMPGYFLSDLGDLIQFGTSVYEDVTDLDRVVVQEDLYDAIMTGYREKLGDILEKKEEVYLSFAGPYMTYMLGLRFLTDYLSGDTYFKTNYEEQNLDKAKNRLALLEVLCARCSVVVL